MRGLPLLLLLAAGCGTEPPADPSPIVDASAPLAFYEIPSFDLTGRGGYRGISGRDLTDPGDRRQMHQDLIASLRLQSDLSGRLNDAPDWRAMEAVADEALPQLPESRRPFAQRDVAERIVRRLVAMPDLAPDDLDALGEYLGTATRLQSTEGDDVLRALLRLEGHWDPAMRAQTARTAARWLGSAYTDQAQCVGCTVEHALADMLPQQRQSLDPLLYEIQTVHQELMRIGRHGAPTL